MITFRALSASLLGLTAFGLSQAAWAVPAPTSSCPAAESVVTREAARATTTNTVGMIVDRTGAVIGTGAVTGGTPGTSTNFALPQGCGSGNIDLTDTGSSTGNKASGTFGNGVWVAGSTNWMKKDDLNGEYRGSVQNAIIGADHRYGPNLVVGVALGTERVNVRTYYSNGILRGENYSISPYAAYAVTDWLNANALIGYGRIKYDTTRNYGAVIGDTTANRWFGSADLTAHRAYGAWQLKAGLGYLRVYEDQKAYTESDATRVGAIQVNFGEIRALLAAAYPIETSYGVVTPNASVRFEYDTPNPGRVQLVNNSFSSTDRTGATVGLGLDMDLKNGLKVGVQGTSAEFRDKTSVYSLIGTMRYEF